jgi:hypothetical protein
MAGGGGRRCRRGHKCFGGASEPCGWPREARATDFIGPFRARRLGETRVDHTSPGDMTRWLGHHVILGRIRKHMFPLATIARCIWHL